jgi:ribbon-helix-helix CopG family protein
MKKTTLYLDEKEMNELKILAAKLSQGSASNLIRRAVRDFLNKTREQPSFSFLKKHLQKKARPTSFGDGVFYQRSLRKEWD